MKLYVTFTSPYARRARILVIEKSLEDRVEIIAAKTRIADSPYYQINPSGRVPYLIDDSGIGMEDSQLICAYLDSLDGKQSSYFYHSVHNRIRSADRAALKLSRNLLPENRGDQSVSPACAPASLFEAAPGVHPAKLVHR